MSAGVKAGSGLLTFQTKINKVRTIRRSCLFTHAGQEESCITFTWVKSDTVKLVQLHSSYCHCFWTHGERWSVKRALEPLHPQHVPSTQTVTSWADFNHEDHHVLVVKWSRVLHSGPFPCSQSGSYRNSAECQVQLQYHLSGFGITSKWDSEKTEIHTPTPNSTKGQWRKPLPSSPLGVVMGMVDSPGRWQPFGPTGGTDSSG